MTDRHSEEQINSIFEAITHLAQLDFSKKAAVSDSGAEIDTIATGINMLSERLEMISKELAIKNNTLRNIQELAGIGTWVLDLENNKLSYSDEVYQIFELKPQEFGATYGVFLDVVHPDDRSKVDTAYTDSIKEGKDSHEIDYRLLIKKTDEIKYVHEKCRHERNVSGDIVRSVGYVQDISELKKKEELLRQNEIRSNEAQKVAQIGSWEVEIETGRVVWSDEMYNIFNCDPAIYKPDQNSLISVIHPEYKDAMQNWIDLSMSGAKQDPLDFQLNDGSDKWIRGQGTFVFNEDGKPLKGYGTAQDITKQTEATKEIENAGKNFMSIYQNNPAGITIIRAKDRKIIDINDVAVSLFGFKSKSEMIGKTSTELNLFNIADEKDKIFQMLRENNVVKDYEVRINNNEGHVIWISASISFIYLNGEQCMLSSAIDITRRKVAEEVLKQSELRLKTAQKTAKIGSWEADIETGVITWSDEMYSIYNCDPATFVIDLESLINLVHPEFRDVLIKQISGIYSGNIEAPFDFRLNTKDGSERWICGQGEAIFNEAGKPIIAFGTAQDITNRKQIERSLTKNIKEIQDLRKALDEATIVAITDNKGIITYANDNFCEISGYTRYELIGQDHRITNSEYHSKDFFKEMWETIVKGDVWKSEIKNKAKDGSFYWVETTIVPFLDEKGMPYQYVSIKIDITNRKKNEELILELNSQLQASMEKELANSHSKMSRAQKVAHLGNWELTLATGIALWSEEACRIYGLDPTESNHSFDSWLKFIHPEDYDYVLNEIEKSRGSFAETSFIYRIIRKDGSVRYIYSEYSYEFSDDGKPISMFGITHDITELKLAELEIVKRKELYKNLLDNMNDGFMVDDLSGRITFANRQFCKIFGCEPDDIVNIKLEDYVSPEFKEELRDRHNRRIAGEKVPNIFEYLGLRKEGTKIWVNAHVNSVVENGKITGTQSVIRDISDRKKSEFELRKTVEELRDRNNELMQFNYFVSHNLRAPIANILGLSDVLNYPDLSMDEVSTIAKDIQGATQTMDAMIKDLNEILSARSTINTVKMQVSILQTIDDVCKTNEKQITESDITINTDIADDANEIYTIKSYLQSIFHNLTSNAIKYKSPLRRPQLDILSRRENNHLKIEISDNGRGIDLNKYGQYIFGLYKRFHLDVEGKGLGLHMTRTQVEALGGKITLHSEPDKGTTFTITLPID